MLEFIKSKQTYFYLLLLCSIGIGLQVVAYKIAIILLLLQWFISADFNNKIQYLKKDIVSVGLILLYLFYAISFFWSDNSSVALNDLLLKLPILILPLVIASQQKLNKKQVSQILLAFASSSILLNLVCLVHGYFSYLETNELHHLYYHKLTLNMHTAYQGMFTCFSIVLLVYLRVKEKFISNWIMYVGVSFQLLLVLLLSSRMQILIIAVLIPTYLIVKYYKQKQLYKGILYSALIFYLANSIMSLPSSLNYRYKQTVTHISSIGVDDDNSDPRKFIWQNGLKVIQENWLFGNGIGDAKDILLIKYSELVLDDPTAITLIDSAIHKIEQNPRTITYLGEKAIQNEISYEEQLDLYTKKILIRKNNRYKSFVKKRYNFHNQYLQTFGTIGIFGILLLLYLFAFPFFKSLKKKDYLFAFFLFVVGSSFLTESMLERQAGVSFIVFFYVLLWSSNQNKHA
jgi:O-antigen ligase